MSITVDDSVLRQKLARASVVLGKGVGELVRFYAGPGVMDLMRTFPPMGSTSGKEAFGKQRRIGVQAVRRDVAKVYVSLATVVDEVRKAANDPDDGAARGFAKLARRNPEQARHLLERVGLGHRARLAIGRFDPGHHRKSRNRKGGVSRRRQAQIVVDNAALNRFRRTLEKRVGIEKSGFLAGFRATGGKGAVPRWISGHTGTGRYVDQTRRKLKPFIEVINSVGYAGAHRGLVRMVLARQRGRMVRGLEAATKRKLRSLR